MTLTKFYKMHALSTNEKITCQKIAKQQGIISIELALIIPTLIAFFCFSWQAGRYLYWQQQFDFTSSRFAKILVLDILKSRQISDQSFEDSLSLIQSQPNNDRFDIGLRIDILSDDTSIEKSTQIGMGCNDKGIYPSTIKNLPAVNATNTGQMPKRYILGISLCAQAKHWTSYLNTSELSNTLITSHSYYPINHAAFN